MTLGELLRKARAKSRKTQADVAGEVGVAQPTVHAWESGQCRPEANRTIAVAKAYGVDPLRMLRAPLRAPEAA